MIIHARAEQYFLQPRNVQYAPFSTDSIPIDVIIYTFLNKTPTNNFPFKSFSLRKFLVIVLSIKVTYIRNGCLA